MLTISKLKKSQLRDFERFVIKEYFVHNITTSYEEKNYTQQIDFLFHEDLAVFEDSSFFVAYKDSVIIGSVKITLWDEKVELPIEKLFKINIKNIAENLGYRHIWHVGRFAITKNNGFSLFKKLLVKAISTICDTENSLMVAECDKKLIKGLNILGVETKNLGSSIFYLGSETIPIYSTHEWLREFLVKENFNANKKLFNPTLF